MEKSPIAAADRLRFTDEELKIIETAGVEARRAKSQTADPNYIKMQAASLILLAKDSGRDASEVFITRDNLRVYSRQDPNQKKEVSLVVGGISVYPSSLETLDNYHLDAQMTRQLLGILSKSYRRFQAPKKSA